MSDTTNIVLEGQDLHKTYRRGDVDGPVLKAASITVNAGEWVAILGSPRSGKSTLLRVLSGREVPDSGDVQYQIDANHSVSLFGLSESERRRLLRTEWGVVHQHPMDGLRSRVSAGGNIGERLMAVGNRHYGDIRAQAIDWLGQVEIPLDRIDDMPITFSGGMQQRLQIARNLVTHPKLVFMDEPTGGVDPATRRQFWEMIYEAANRGITIFVTTHYMDEAEYCNRVSIMDRGKIMAYGTPGELKDKYGVDSMNDVFLEIAR